MSDASGQLLVQEVAASPLTQDLLCSSVRHMMSTKSLTVSLYDTQLTADYVLMYVLFVGLLFFRSRWQLNNGLEGKRSIRCRETLSTESSGCKYLCLRITIHLQSSIFI